MPLKKSYSEQGRFTKRPQQWQRSKSNPGAHLTNPAPLVPVSNSTKNKLKAFQFEDSKPQPEKVQSPVARSEKVEPCMAEVNLDAPGLPTWHTLLGAEERTNNEEEDVSPNGEMVWLNHDENGDRITKPTSTPMLTRYGKKRRARSSSPASSPAPNAKRVAYGRKTPQADPALELWDRFALPGANANSTGLTNPLLSRMMMSSSPRPPRDASIPGSERSLRKSVSCGSNWPPKRRKIERLDIEQTYLSQGNEKSNSKSSLVSALLETVDGAIRKTETTGEAEENSSPSRRKSPRKSRLNISQQREHSAPEQPQVNPNQPSRSEKAFSDYGDDDFDDDTLMELDASIVNLVQADESTLIDIEEPAPALTIPAAIKVAEDEFGDLNDDFFDGAEDLMAVVESNLVSKSAVQGQGQDRSPPPDAVKKDVGDEFDDEFDDDFGDDIDLEALELAATQSAARAASAVSRSSQKPNAIQSHEFPEKLLLVQVDRTNEMKTIHLRGDWYETDAHPKAFVHVIGDFDRSGKCIVDNNQNMLILHPDQLISATVLADSFTCMRRAVLQDRVKATGEASQAMVYGTILHEIFQEALMVNNWEPEFLGQVVTKTLKKHLEDLYVIKVSFDDARSHVLSKTPEIRAWAQRFVSARPKPDALVQGRNGEKVTMCLSKLLDVEEHVWSPMYGLKGNIDATVQITMEDKTGSKTLTVPFEVKTGKSVSSAHQAQTLLYNLLLSDRYDVEIVYGILYYMETSQTIRIPALRQEFRHMILQRNRLAVYIRERSVQLPAMKKDKFLCGKCYAQTTCFIYHKLADDGTGETSGLKDKFDDLVQHLSPTHKEFFLKWEDLLTMEEKESQKHRRELWTMVSTERERLGRCLSNVIIEDGTAHEDKNSTKINRFFYTFVKDSQVATFSFLDSQLAVGEPIVVSDEQGHFALAIGFVTSVKKHRISVAVDRRLHNARIRQPGFNDVENQVFASIMDVTAKGAPTGTQGNHHSPPVRYRLDKDEFSNGMATVRNNLVQIMADGPFGSREIRRLVVDLFPPGFKTVPTQYAISDKDGLNSDQKAAIEKVMSARDYALVLGMPGTGKTTTISHIIRALVSQGKTVLLTSYTHSAVDNILLKLKHDNAPILRLGAPTKIHPEVREFAVLASEPKSSFEDIRKAWHETPIVATTCLGINHPIFNERTFDYCIVDEASQITLPVCLGPIRMARTFVLVGDHNQLPPLVQNDEARLGGLDVSLFKLLSDTHPSSVVNLEHQYRMCEDVMTLSNTLIYEGRLKCGVESLRRAALHVPNMAGLQSRHLDAAAFISMSQGRSAPSSYMVSPQKKKPTPVSPNTLCPAPIPGRCWLQDLLDPQARVRFVNTDALSDSREQAKGNRIVNPCEARVVAQLVDALLSVGVPASEIGVMTHYRSQLAQLRHLLRGHGGGIEMHTADRFQGRDKEVVVLSLVRNNENCSIGELLKDWRRINVAFTRAKTKLLVIGSKSTLGGCGEKEMLARFIGLMEEKRWVYDLKDGCLDGHWFPEGGENTQATTTTAAASPVKKIKIETVSPVRSGCSLLSSSAKVTKAPNKKIKGKENGPKRITAGERVLTKGKPVLRDILNDMMGGY
ncbi:hypothetical protein OQA88_10094 [Cercophora sp. LCS_1]